MSTRPHSDQDDGRVRWFIVDVTSHEEVDPVAVEFGYAAATVRMEQLWADSSQQVALVAVEPDTPAGSFRVVAAANVQKSDVESNPALMEGIARAIASPG